jgi:hypothetical protein
MSTQHHKPDERDECASAVRQNLDYVLSHDFQVWLASEPPDVQKRWETRLSQKPPTLIAIILDAMKRTWTNHGSIGEPYSEPVALEVATNELLDWARERGWTPTHNGKEISPLGIVLRVEN